MALKINRTKSPVRNMMIPDSLTHSSGTITAVFGPKVYQTVLSGLSANTRYQLYIVPSGQMVYSTNENSVGPSGYTNWILIGSFHAGIGNVVGQFIESLTGTPTTDFYKTVTSSNWGANAASSGSIRRNGVMALIYHTIILSGAPTGSLSIGTPSNLTVDTSKLGGDSTVRAYLGSGMGVVGGTAYTFQVNRSGGTLSEPLYQSSNSAQESSITATLPVTWASGNTLQFTYEVPIAGWVNTPIAYL